MKRIITVIVAAAALLGLVAAPASATSRAAVPVNGCVWTASYPLTHDNGLAWSNSDNEAFHTPMFRAGACRHVMVQSFGVYNGPPCFYGMVKTYNENGSLRVRGPWIRFDAVGNWRDLRPTIDVGRLHRVYVHACGAYRDIHHPPSMAIYSH
jgi:hypothetical protein